MFYCIPLHMCGTKMYLSEPRPISERPYCCCLPSLQQSRSETTERETGRVRCLHSHGRAGGVFFCC